MNLLEITENGFLFIYGIAGVVYFLLLGITISTAIRVNKRDRHSKIIIELLAKIAEKNGVDKDDLETLVTQSQI